MSSRPIRNKSISKSSISVIDTKLYPTRLDKELKIENPQINQVLSYDGSNWVNTFSQGGGIGFATLRDLQDIDLSNDSNLNENEVLTYDGSKWTNSVIPNKNIDDLLNVNINTSNLSKNQILSYNGSEWVNTNNTAGGISTTLAGLNDTIFKQPIADNQILTYNDSNWINYTIGLNDLTDTNTSSAYDGQILTWNSSAWVPDVAFSNGCIKMGLLAGNSGVSNSIAIGVLSGNSNQATDTIAIGNSAGSTGQKTQSIAIGNGAAQTDQQEGSIAIGGNETGRTNQKKYSVAIGGTAGTNNQGEYSLSLGSKTNSLGNYSITIGNDCDTACNNSIVFNANSTEFNKSTLGLYISPGSIQNAKESNTLLDNVLYYNNSTGEIKSRIFQRINVYSGTDPLLTNTTGISIERNINRNGRYIINYSEYASQVQITFPTIQIVPYIFDTTEITETLIREISASYFHDPIDKKITVHMGTGTTFRNEFYFSFSFTDLGQLLFYGIAGGSGDASGNDVIKEITSINFSGDQLVPSFPTLTENYTETFEWEHIVTVRNGEDSFHVNPFTAVSEDGAPVVSKSIQSISDTIDGRDIELHIMIITNNNLIHHMHYKNFPLDKCFDYTIKSGEIILESPVFAKFGNSNSWQSGAWTGGAEPLQHFGGWTFSSGLTGTFNSSTNGFYSDISSIQYGSNIGSNLGWSSVVVYARKCIGRSDCIINNNINLARYIAPDSTGQGTILDIYPGSVYVNLPGAIERFMPCWGIPYLLNDFNITLTRTTRIFLFRSNTWPTPFDSGDFNNEDLWELVDGTYTSHFSTNPDLLTIIYTKIVPPGSYTLDGYLAMYLFADAHGLEPT